MTATLQLFALEPVAPVQTGPVFRGYIGKCPRNACTHAERHAPDGLTHGECPRHGFYPLERLYGERSAHHCNAACMGAIGRTCECSCGGANHGAWHAR